MDTLPENVRTRDLTTDCQTDDAPVRYSLPEYLNTRDLATLCRTNEATVRYWRHLGTGPRGFKVGRGVLYARDDVTAWLADARRQSSSAGRPTDRESA